MSMRADPILQEVHRMKDQFAREMGYDLDKMFEHLRANEQKHPERMVSAKQVDKISGRKPARRKSAKG